MIDLIFKHFDKIVGVVIVFILIASICGAMLITKGVNHVAGKGIKGAVTCIWEGCTR